MYATIDGVPVEGNPSGALNGFPPGVNTITSLGTMAFIGGKNIDSLARDAYNVPQFSSQVNITAPVGGSTNPSSVAFTIDSTNSTAYSAVAQTYTNSQDGSPLSQLSSYSFDSTGKLVAQYTNGKSKIQGQVALATFGNNEGLIPIGGNSFEASALSGSATTGTAGSGIFGALKSQALEQSNVDLTGELVTLMALQRQYSAASQVVKTSQTIEDDILNKLG
jgi:flagellar hook protein FlgE